MSFELKFFVCRHVSMWGFQNRVCLSVRPSVRLSVCPHPEKRNPLSFVNISPTLVIDTSMEWSTRVLHHGNPEMWKIFRKFEIDEIEFCPYPEFPNAEKINHLGFVNISPTSVANWYVNEKGFTSTTTWEPKNLIFFFKKVWNWIWLVFWLVLKSWNHSSGLNMHLYVDIGDASSSLWGSTSSYILLLFFFLNETVIAIYRTNDKLLILTTVIIVILFWKM